MSSRDRALTSVARILTSPISARQVAARETLFAFSYLLCAWFAISTRLPDSPMSLVWPSAGVATLWLLTASRRSLPWDAGALALVAALGTLLSGAPLPYLVALPAGTLVAAWAMRTLVRRWVPGVARPLEGVAARRLGTFVALAAGAAVAALSETLVGLLLLELFAQDPVWSGAAHRWSRGWTAVFTVSSVGVLGLASLGRRVGSPEQRLRRAHGLPRRSHRLWESTAILVLTAVLLAITVWWFPELPLSFALFVPAAWVGVRFSPLVAAVYALATGLVVIGATLAEQGRYARVDSPFLSAFLAQTYFAVLFVTVLTLALLSTRLRTAEQRAHSRAELLDRVLASATDGVLLVAESGRVELVNRAALQLFAPLRGQVGRAQDLGLERLRRADATRTPLLDLPHERALAGGRMVGEELLLPGDGGGDRVLRVTAQTIVGPHRQPQALVTFHDVTAEHAQTNALRAFAGELAHDLKNPLTVVEGWSEMLEGEFLDAGSVPAERGLPMLRRVQGAAGHMRTLIEELLSYTVARGHVLEHKRLDLGPLVEEIVAGLTQASHDDPVPVVEAETPHPVLADRVLVRQLLDNLIGNAVKYVAPDTTPRVRVSTRLEDGRVRVDVTDNGLGVPEEHRRRVFDSLYRIDRPGYDGTGLGLAICARIVERHDGALSVGDGPDGVGSTFTFTLPVAPA